MPTLLWADLTNVYVWIAVLATAAFGAHRFPRRLPEDRAPLASGGSRPRYKLGRRSLVGARRRRRAAVCSRSENLYSTRLIFPFFKQLIPDLGWLYVPFAVSCWSASSNAVNLTDGLDGLAISTFAVAAAAFTALAYVTGHRVFAEYLLLVRFPPAGGADDLLRRAGRREPRLPLVQRHPAEIFMGDVGSLALGGALGTVAILIKQELLLVIVGGVFVLEALSVMIQVASFKMTRQARLQDGAAAPPLRADRLERAEGHHAVPDRGDRLRAVQPDDAEAALMAERMTSPSAGRRVMVVGAARSGVAAARLLRARGARVTLTDRARTIADAPSCGAAGVELELGGHPRETFERADLIVLSPGVPPALPEVRRARAPASPVIGELELASRWLRGPIVAITGTKGKSTTTTLVGRMLERPAARAGRRQHRRTR